MKYRIKNIKGIGFFAQVRLSVFSGWKTIGKHPGGAFGLYPDRHESYPLKQDDARGLCESYREWVNLINAAPTYAEYK